jgi:hypothetical protein
MLTGLEEREEARPPGRVAAEATQRSAGSLRTVRWAAHAAVWSVLWVPTVAELARGWRASGDDATIAYRSYQVFSAHSPLVGMFSTTTYGSGHIVYDPGPLLFWLLSVPVRIDPAHGALWGAALWCAVALSVGLEALWSAGHRFACAVLALAVVDLAWLVPEIFVDPVWNPNLSFVFAVVSIVLAVVVAGGALRWWPVLVLTASVAVQSEFFYAFVCALAVVLSVLIGVRRRRGRSWTAIVAGLAVGLACWTPSIVQQVTATRGNLGLILGANRTAPLGLGFALRAVAFAASPLWQAHYKELIADPGRLKGASPVLGAAIVVTGVVVTAWALRSRRRALATMAMAALSGTLAMVVTVAIVPGHLYLNVVRYLLYWLWPLSVCIWAGIGSAVVSVGRRLWARRRAKWSDPVPGAASALLSGGVVVIALATTAGLVGVPTDPRVVAANELTVPSSSALRLQQEIVARVEAETPKGRVQLAWCVPTAGCPSDLFTLVSTEYFVGVGVAWQLSADGWAPELPRWFTRFSGIAYQWQPGTPTVPVAVVDGRAIVGPAT